MSLKNLKKRQLRSWLTMIGIFIGIAAVVSLISLGEGLRSTITSQFSSLGTDILSVTASGGFGPPGSGAVNPLTDDELDEIKKVPGVDGAAGRLIEAGKLLFNDKIGFGYAASMPDGGDRKLVEKAANLKTQKGRLLKDGDSGVVVVGASFYEDEMDGKGFFGKPIIPGSKVKIQDKTFEVVGILEKKGSFTIDGVVLMSEDEMRGLFDIPSDEYDVIAVKVVKNADMDNIKETIERKLRKVRGVEEGEENFEVQTPQSALESVNSTLLAVQIFVYIIAGISLLVGGIGIMNTMYTSVVERTKEVGIMKSIGAKNSAIFTLFFIESGLIGTIGGIIGIIGGVSLALFMSFIGRLALGSDLISAEISPLLIIGALLFSFFLGSIFGTLPAVQASKLNPVDALRYAK